MFTRAVKQPCKLMLAVNGVAGSGKTYSALALAAGLGERTAVIDAERGCEQFYADKFCFDVSKLSPPFTADRFIREIQEAQRLKYDTLIVDSLSLAWSGAGGILDSVDEWKHKHPQRKDQWLYARKALRRLMDALQNCPCHVICTIRSKTGWTMGAEKHQGAELQRPARSSIGLEQQSNIEYEFDVVFDLLEGRKAHAAKDRTGLFSRGLLTPDKSVGEQIRAWASPRPQGRIAEHLNKTLQRIAQARTVNELSQLWVERVREWRGGAHYQRINDAVWKRVRELEGTAPTEPLTLFQDDAKSGVRDAAQHGGNQGLSQ